MTRDDQITVSATRSARAYLKDGFKVIPVPAGKKGPRIKRWQELNISRQEVAQHFNARNNIGVLLGAKADWLVDVDLDADEAVTAAEAFLPKTGWVHGRPGKPRSHRFYRAKGVKTKRFIDPKGQCLVELRSTGCQTLVPPSLHPSGERYRWDQQGKPNRVPAKELYQRVARVAACTLIARSWPKRGDRHSCALALAGLLLGAGWSAKQVEHFLATAARIAGDEEYRKRTSVVRDTKKRLSMGKPVTGRRALEKILGASVVHLISDWLEATPNPAKGPRDRSSENRDFNLTAVRLLELDQPQRRIVEVKAEIAGAVETFHVLPAVVRDAKKLASVIADRPGEMLNNDDPRLVRLRHQIPSIPRVHAVSQLGWTATHDVFMYGTRPLRTAGFHGEAIFLTGETR